MSITKISYSMVSGSPVNVVDYGAIADGVTDNTAAFALAVARLGSVGGGTLWFPAAPLSYNGTLIINHSNIHVIGYGATLGNMAQNTLYIEPTLGVSNLGPLLGYATTSPSSINTPAAGATFYAITNTAITSNVVTINTTPTTTGANPTISVGDWVVLYSGTAGAAGANNPVNYIPKTHQIVKVLAVSGANITISENADAAITGASDWPTLVKWDMVSNICVEGLEITNTGGVYLCAISGVIGLQFKNIEFNCRSQWGAMSFSRDVVIDHCRVIGPSGFANGRGCENLTCNDSFVGITNTWTGSPLRTFWYCEENVKRITFDNCYGLDAALSFYLGETATVIAINDCVFSMVTPNLSALTLTTIGGDSSLTAVNSVFSSYGGTTAAPFDGGTAAVIQIAYNTTTCLFNGCRVLQLASGVEIAEQHNGGGTFSVIKSLIAANSIGAAVSSLTNSGAFIESSTTTLTSSPYNLAGSDRTIICDVAGALVLVLAAGGVQPGRTYTVLTLTANTVGSHQANVYPLGSNILGSAILSATAGKWADIVYDGTNWRVIRGN